MKYKYSFFLAFILVAGCQSNNQKVTTKNFQKNQLGLYNIYLKEFATYFIPDSCKGKFAVDINQDNSQLWVDLMNCEGELNFVQIKNNKKILEGKYKKSLDTLVKYSYGRSAVDEKETISLLKYFQPLPEGIWRFYENDSIIKIVTFKGGIEIQ